MLRPLRISLFVVSTLAIGLLGLVLGRWATMDDEENPDPYDYLTGLLGERIPDVTVFDSEGHPVKLRELLADEDALILLLAPGCDPCSQAIASIESSPKPDPELVRIIGVCPAGVEETREYSRSTGFSYPLYADAGRTLARDFGLDKFPSVMGIRSARVTFTRLGFPSEFTLNEASEMLFHDADLEGR